MRVRDGVESFQLRWPDRPEPLSVHLVETNEATLLFGAGAESTADDLVWLLRRRDVDVVVVEHGDPDHYGGVPRLRAELDVAVAAPAQDARLLVKDGVAPDHRLESGETYWGVEALEFPGHTPGNMAFRYGDTVVAGDTVVGRDSAFATNDTGTGPLAVINSEYNHDDALARESACAFAELNAETVLVTHGSNTERRGRPALVTLRKELERKRG